MNNNLRIPSPWSQLALFLGLFVGGLIIAAVVVVLLPGVEPGKLPTDSASLKKIQAITSVIVFGVPCLAFGSMVFRKDPVGNLGFRPAIRSSFYGIAILLLFVSFPLEGWLGMINKHMPMAPWMVKMEQDNDKMITAILNDKSTMAVVTNLLVIAVIPGIFEELCFRGVLQRILIQICKNPWVGIVLTGILFSAFHMQFEGFLPRMYLGILLGAIFWYSGSIWPNILAHICFNGIQVLIAFWYPAAVTENPAIPTYWALLSLVLVILLLRYMRNHSTITYAQVYP